MSVFYYVIFCLFLFAQSLKGMEKEFQAANKPVIDLLCAKGINQQDLSYANGNINLIATKRSAYRRANTSEKQAELDKQLRTACSQGNLDEVKKLIAQGANVNYNQSNVLFAAVLFAAICGGNEKIVPLLLENGANVDMLCGLGGQH